MNHYLDSNRQFKMTSLDQTQFLRRIRTALGQPPEASRAVGDLFAEGPSNEERQLLETIRRRTAAERQVLLERLVEAGKPINLKVTALPGTADAAGAIARLVDEKTPEWGESKRLAIWQHPLIERLDLAKALDRLKVPVHVTDPMPADADPDADRAECERQRAEIIASFIGVTSADFCLADTATLVLRNRPGQPRSAALVPSIHVAVIRLDQVLADMKELFALLRWDERYRPEGLSNYMSFISGPSKTADIEATMVHGAHGPREVHVVILDNGRLGLAENDDFRESLYCLKCGGCMLVCPVFQAVGGHVFGGPVYPGGIGTLMTAMTESVAESAKTLDLCADCRKCQDFCPVGIRTGELLVKLKASQGASLPEKGLSLVFALGFYATVRLADMARLGVLGEVFAGTREARFFQLEMAIGVILPIVLLSLPAVRRNTERLFRASLLVVAGLVVNRLNVSLTGFEGAQGGHYVPSVAEGIITLMLVGIGMAVFGLAVRYLPIMEKVEEPELVASTEPSPARALAAVPVRS